MHLRLTSGLTIWWTFVQMWTPYRLKTCILLALFCIIFYLFLWTINCKRLYTYWFILLMINNFSFRRYLWFNFKCYCIKIVTKFFSPTWNSKSNIWVIKFLCFCSCINYFYSANLWNWSIFISMFHLNNTRFNVTPHCSIASFTSSIN